MRTFLAVILAAGATYGSDAVIGGPPDRYLPLAEAPAATALPPQSRDIGMGVILRNSAARHDVTVLGEDLPKTSRPAVLRGHPLPLRPRATIIDSCTTITAPGTYVLTADLMSDQSCLRISATHDVVLSCNHNSLTSKNGQPMVVVDGVTHFSMSNCTFYSDKQNVYGPPIDYEDVAILNSSKVQFSSNVVNTVFTLNTTDSHFTNNQFHAQLVLKASTNNTVSNNTFVVDHDPTVNAAIYSYEGSSNTFTNNSIDGRWNERAATYEAIGADCGIDLGAESNDVVTNNYIHDCWNAGIETYDQSENTLIANNRINDILGPMVSSFWNTSWIHNTVRGNYGTNVAAIWDVQVWDNVGLRIGPVPEHLYFQDNTFENNGMDGQSTPTDRYPHRATVNLIGNPYGPVIASNNVIKDNDFGAANPGPDLNPASAFIDGGGNICGRQASSTPVTCH